MGFEIFGGRGTFSSSTPSSAPWPEIFRGFLVPRNVSQCSSNRDEIYFRLRVIAMWIFRFGSILEPPPYKFSCQIEKIFHWTILWFHLLIVDIGPWMQTWKHRCRILLATSEPVAYWLVSHGTTKTSIASTVSNLLCRHVLVLKLHPGWKCTAQPIDLRPNYLYTSDVAFPEKYYVENFPERKNVCRPSLFLYLTVLYSHIYFEYI